MGLQVHEKNRIYKLKGAKFLVLPLKTASLLNPSKLEYNQESSNTNKGPKYYALDKWTDPNCL